MGHAFWKENIEDSKIIGINHSKLLCKGNNGDLHKIGLKMRE